MNQVGPSIISIVGGIIGLAIVAVLVAKNAQTSSVIQGTGTALSSIIQAAVQPVSSSGNNQFGSVGGATS
jgi:hypothetical protein